MMKNLKYLLLLTLMPFTLMANGSDSVEFPKLKGWKLKVSGDVYTPGNLWDLINGAAELYLAYDFVDLHLADYKNKSAGITVHAEVYRHSSLNNAYGIYSSERSPNYSFLDIGGQTYIDEGILNSFSGQFYVKLYSTDEGEAVQESLKKIGEELIKALDTGSDLPGPAGVFPEEGRLPYSVQYIAKDFLGFDFLHSAFMADYEESYKLFIIVGKDSSEILEMVKSYLKFTKQEIDISSNSAFIIEDRYNGHIPVVISGKYLIGIQDGADNDKAKISLAELAENVKSLD
jgi:hypothetical protein